MIPPAKRGGRRREVNVREVLNAIFYVLSTGCQWQALPKDLPPKSTAHHYFGLWDWDGTLERIHHALYVETRERAGREASPTAAIIDSQSGKAAQKGALALDPQGFDAGKKITGRKRHILVDTLGLLLSVAVHPANVQDRDGAGDLLRTARRSFPFIERIFADAGYQGPKMAKVVAKTGAWTLQIVKRSDRPSLCRSAQALDRRAHLCLDQPQPPFGPRLRALRPNRRRLLSPRHDPHHAAPLDPTKPFSVNPFFLDRLLG